MFVVGKVKEKEMTREKKRNGQISR